MAYAKDADDDEDDLWDNFHRSQDPSHNWSPLGTRRISKDADCSICTNNFDSGQRQAVELPCGHEFCLSCLVSLKARNEYKCPRCRRNWADMDVRALPVMSALAVALERDQEEAEDDLGQKKKVDGFCKKHSLPFDFWVTKEKEFYCKKCAAKGINVTLKLIDDAIPDIKATLCKEAQDAGMKVRKDLQLLNNFNTKIEDSWSDVRKFKELIDALDNQFKDCSKEIKSTKSTLTKSLMLIEKVEGKVATITNEGDVDVVVESRTTLQHCTGPSRMPSSDLPDTLLCDIAGSYMKKRKPDSEPTREAFVDQLRQNSPVRQQAAESLTQQHQRQLQQAAAPLTQLHQRQQRRLEILRNYPSKQWFE